MGPPVRAAGGDCGGRWLAPAARVPVPPRPARSPCAAGPAAASRGPGAPPLASARSARRCGRCPERGWPR